MRAAESPEHATLNRLIKAYTSVASMNEQHGNRTGVLAEPRQFRKGLECLISRGELQQDEQLRCLLESSRGGNGAGDRAGNGNGDSLLLETGDRLMQNRRIVQAVFEQASGKPLLRSSHHGFDAIIASDAGKKFEVSRPERIGGFLRTALRSSDILMDRAWQLEKEHFL